MERTEPRQLFRTGQIVVTAGVMSSLTLEEISECVYRHIHGDFGILEDEDRQANIDAIRTGEDRIFSAYNYDCTKYYVITEWDRSVTTVLRADEY